MSKPHDSSRASGLDHLCVRPPILIIMTGEQLERNSFPLHAPPPQCFPDASNLNNQVLDLIIACSACFWSGQWQKNLFSSTIRFKSLKSHLYPNPAFVLVQNVWGIVQQGELRETPLFPLLLLRPPESQEETRNNVNCTKRACKQERNVLPSLRLTKGADYGRKNHWKYSIWWESQTDVKWKWLLRTLTTSDLFLFLFFCQSCCSQNFAWLCVTFSLFLIGFLSVCLRLH